MNKSLVFIMILITAALIGLDQWLDTTLTSVLSIVAIVTTLSVIFASLRKR